MSEMEALRELVKAQKIVKELRERVQPDSPVWIACNEIIGSIDRSITEVMGKK